MMSKLIRSLMVLGMCGAVAAGLGACAKQAGPLSPSINALGAGSTPNSGDTLRYSTLTTPANVSATAQVVFNVPLNPASINASTVLLYTLDASGTTETLFTAYTLSYNALSKMIVITPAGGAWANDQRYHLVLTTGLQSVSGRPLDGNSNGLAESSEFDNLHYAFSLGAPVSLNFSTANLNSSVTYSATITDKNGSYSLPFDGTTFRGNLNNYYAYVTVTVTFTVNPANPSDFQMDTSTFFTDAVTLHPNVSLTDVTGTVAAPVNVTVTSSVANAYNVLTVVLNPAAATSYKLKLKGGLAGIRSGQASTLRLRRGYYFDGNGSGAAESADDTKDAIFGTGTATGGNNPRVYISGVIANGMTSTTGLRRFEITFSVPTGTGTIDPATVNTSTISLFNDTAGMPIVPAAIVLNNATAPNPVVYVYVPMRIVTSGTSGGNNTVRLFVSKNIKSSDGVALDNNSDGIAGTDADNYRTTGSTVTNY